MEQKQRDSTSSQKQEVVIISPEELKKLGITKNLILAHNSQENTVDSSSPGSTPTTTPTSSPNSKSNIKTSPIVLNAQVSRNYMKAVYGTARPPGPRPATLAKKSFPQPATITFSPARQLVTNKPDILNSKVCLPMRKVISMKNAKLKTECANMDVEKKPELEVANVPSDDEVLDLDSSKDDGQPSTVQDTEKTEEKTQDRMGTSHSDGELIMATTHKRMDERQPKKLINVISVASVQLPQHAIRDLVKSSNANDSDKVIAIQKQIHTESNISFVDKISSSTVSVKPNLVYGETKNLSEIMTKEDPVSLKPSINEIDKTLNEDISDTPTNETMNNAAMGEKTICCEQDLPNEKLHEEKDDSTPLKEILVKPSIDDEVIILDPEDPIEPKQQISHAISSSGKDTNIPQVVKKKAKTQIQPLAAPIPASRTFKTVRVYSKKFKGNPSENRQYKNKSLKTVKVRAVNMDQIPLNVRILKAFKSVDEHSMIPCNERTATVIKDNLIETDTERLEKNDNENTRSNNNNKQYFPAKDNNGTTTAKGKKRAGRSRKTPIVADQTMEVHESLFDQSKSEDIKCSKLGTSIKTPGKRKRDSTKSSLDQPVADSGSAIIDSNIEDGDLNEIKATSLISRIPRKATRVSYREDEDDDPPDPKSKVRKPKKKFQTKNFQDGRTVHVHVEHKYGKQSASGKDKNIKVTNQETDRQVNQDMESSSKSSKKRGRPKKQAGEAVKDKESLVNNKESLVKDEESPVDLESSKSGRKRKRVDYFAMENNFYEMEYSNMNNKRYEYKGLSSQKKGEKEFGPKETPKKGRRGRKPKSEKLETDDFDETVSPRRKKNEKSFKVRSKKGEGVNSSSKGDIVEGESSLIDLSDSVISDVQSINQSVVGIFEELGEGPCKTEGKTYVDDVEESGSKENKSGSQTAKDAGNTEHGIEESELEQTLENSTAIDDSLNNAEKSEKKRYSKTGQTAAMVQNVFMAAMKTFCDSDDEGDGAKKPQLQSWTSPKVKPRIGRPPKRGYNSSGHSLDINDEATCVTCHETISMEEWTDHNIYEHYNLSWHSAEEPLDLEDTKITQKRLKVALKVLNHLECRICSENFTVVNDYMNHVDECSGVVTNGKVKCVICKVEIDKNGWLKHKLKMHNNLAWRKGDLPLELDNQQRVMDILKTVLKQKKLLYCYKCHSSKKSIVGYLSHQAQCGQKEAKVECNICGRKMLPVSIPTHMKMHNEKSNRSSPKSHLKQEVILGEIKRRAAQKALTVISAVSKDMVQQDSSYHYIKQDVFQVEGFFRNILADQLSENGTIKCKHKGCDHEDDDVDALLDHLTQCKKKPESSYVCKNCLLITSDEKEMREHVLIYLQDDQPEYVADELELEDVIYQEILKKRKIDETRLEKFPNFKAKPTFLLLNGPKRRKELYVCAFEYTLEFCNEHFTVSELFPSFHYKKSDWQLVEEAEMETYLPKNDCSCQVARISLKQYFNNPNTDYVCKTYELFEVQQDGLFQAIFCGGPVHAMAWLPTPHMYLECDQVLAVAVANTFEAIYKMNMNYTEPSSIQFWHFGILKNKSPIPKAQLMFCLAVDIGPVWHLEWCPSGCYSQKKATNDNMNRMGLLAVAGSVPTVHIYAIPFLDENDRELIYKLKPLLKLQLCQDEENPSQKYFPSRISWSKASGHKYIAVGYTNGMVGIFNLKCASNLLRFKDKQDKVEVILPYKTIKAHKSRITVLSMIHLKGGSTWLLTGSYDKRVCTWNLDDNTNIAYSNKKIPYDGTWMTNWIVHVTAPDSFSSAVLTLPSSIKSHRDYLSDSSGVLQSNSSVMSISTSDWLNGMIQGNASGDIVGCFPSQLACSFDNEKMGDLRHVLGCTKLVSKPEVEGLQNRMDKSNIMDYQWSTQRHNLVFCDLEMNRYSEGYKQLAAKIKARNDNWDEAAKQMDLYPVASVNKICFNPNCQASLYYATGYQAGFVRLSYLKFLENDKQVV